MAFDEAGLLDILSKSQDSLVHLSFHSLRITSGSWSCVFEHLHTTPFPNLQRLSLFMCSEGPTSAAKLIFCRLIRSLVHRTSPKPDFEFDFGLGHIWRDSPHVLGILLQTTTTRDPAALKGAFRAVIDKSDLEVNRGEALRCTAAPGCLLLLQQMHRRGGPREHPAPADWWSRDT